MVPGLAKHFIKQRRVGDAEIVGAAQEYPVILNQMANRMVWIKSGHLVVCALVPLRLTINICRAKGVPPVDRCRPGCSSLVARPAVRPWKSVLHWHTCTGKVA